MACSLPSMPSPPPLDGRRPSVTTEAFAAHGLIVRVTGDLDLALAPRLDEAIAREIARGHRHFAIDLSGATFLDCASVGTLVRALAPLRDEPDASVVLAGATGPVERILSLLRLEAVFEIVEDVRRVALVGGAPGHTGVEGWRWAAAPDRRLIRRGSDGERAAPRGPGTCGPGSSSSASSSTAPSVAATSRSASAIGVRHGTHRRRFT